MMSRQRRAEVAQQFADRRRREDEAPRLRDEVPRLASLALTIVERRAGGAPPGQGHIRRVVVDRAPALFVVPCSAPGCDGGTHDLTRAVMRELRLGSARFEDECGCDGCACVLSLVGTAEYR